MVLRRGSPLGLRGRASQRRLTSWGLGPGGTVALPISASGAFAFATVAVPTETGLTVVRTRGEVLLTLITATGSLDGFRGAFGIGIATDRATAIGITALPSPISDEDQDMWLYHRYFTVVANISTEADFGLSAALRFEVDSKAMRKLPIGMAIFAAIEVVEVGAAVMDASFNSRLLLKLS